ncbi:hypothetical protein Pan14r_31600 [Crateriforma conspicua]|uniref:Uncharacterized protein n=1 Tax=Crateriforma conspicua TaxID=2527996 RepID=A0A5C5YC04_9PLAN|nr:hypothetical protein Mal65_46310 [Crateriforma conspicua]TWT70852.1 hypothetical protein Pan14r_31600 [Crateriforma conspicua]
MKKKANRIKFKKRFGRWGKSVPMLVHAQAVSSVNGAPLWFARSQLMELGLALERGCRE